MAKLFAVVLLMIYFLSAIPTPSAAAKPLSSRLFPFSGAILWSDAGGPTTTRLHISMMYNGKIVSERIAYQMPSVVSNGSRLFALSPDGHEVIAHLPSDIQTGDGDLSVIDLPSRRMRQITQDDDYNREFPICWSPDGRYFCTIRSEASLKVFDATTKALLASVESAFVPVWSRDSRSVVFSRFRLDGKPPNIRQLNIASSPPTGLKRQFWTLPVTGGAPVQISEAELDRRIGPAYRPAIDVLQRCAFSGAGSSFWRDDPETFQLMSNGSRAVIVTDVILPEVSRIHATEMIETPVRLDRTCFYLVGERGVTKRRIVRGGYGLSRWSRNGRYVYGGGRDVDGQQVLIAIDSRTLRASRLALGDEWQERDIEDVREILPPHENKIGRSIRAATPSAGPTPTAMPTARSTLTGTRLGLRRQAPIWTAPRGARGT